MGLACSLIALVLAGSPAGARHLESTIQDDALLLHSPPALVQQVARRMADLGVDRVRITAGWSALAPRPRGFTRPGPPFDPADSSTYPSEPWVRLDRAVKAADDAGLAVQLDVAFWAPRWAVQRPSAPNPDRPRWAPDPAQFGRFAGAVARRYDGTFPDPEQPGRKLPAVRMYTTWNEPNNPSFLQPQWLRRGGRWQAESPHVYRALHEAAYAAIKRVSASDLVLIGGTASTGSRTPGKGGVPPLRFVRELACVDARLRPLRIPECDGYRPLRADGYAHHPYGMFAAPDARGANPDDARLADSGRLETLLAQLAAAGRLAQRLPLYDTEYGYESDPPDPFAPFSPTQQAQFLSEATYLAWSDPGTRMFGQFLLQDQPPGVGEAARPAARTRRRPVDPVAVARQRWKSLQTGLFYPDGAPKPAAQAFRLPFWAQSDVVAGQAVVRLFGGVRPGPGRQLVRVERRDAAGGDWVPLQVTGDSCAGSTDFLTDDQGWFLRAAPYTGPASYRLSHQLPDGSWESGVEVPVSAPAGMPSGGPQLPS